MRSLYEISKDYTNIFEQIDFETGEVDASLIKSLAEAEDDLNEKIISVSKYIKNLEAEQEAVKSEAKKMSERAKIIENKVSRLKNYICREMQFSNITKATSDCFNVMLRKNPPKLELKDENVIPIEYKKVKYEWDKAKIKQDLKDGLSVNGAVLVNGKSIHFK
tara:strand:- start:244 stop:732 length:489 start_codon:yes stop_codon:yes gene_type:complete